MKQNEEQRKLHKLAKVHNVLDMWQGSQNQHATQKESCAHNTQITAVGYISDPEQIKKEFWLLFQHECGAVLQLSG